MQIASKLGPIACGLLLLSLLALTTQGATLQRQAPVFNVKDYGAKGDGKSKDTLPIVNAIAALSRAGGGELYFPSGTFLTGAFNVTSNMTMHLDKDAKIQGSTDMSDYPILPPLPSYGPEKSHGIPRFSSLIHGDNVQGLTITGKGTIDGSGYTWWGYKVTQTKPCLVELMNGQGLQITGITLQNSPFWTLHTWASSNIVIDSITILNPPGSPHTDGIDVDSSENVLVHNVWIATGDDHISIKSGSGLQGRTFGRPSQNVLVRSSFFTTGAGLAIGSETAGGINNVTFSNNQLDLAANAVRIKGCVNNGNTVENIFYDQISLTGGGVAVLVDQFYECKPDNKTTPTSVRNVNITNLKTTGTGTAGKFQCAPSNPCQVNMAHVQIDLSLYGFSCSNVQGQTSHVSPKPCY